MDFSSFVLVLVGFFLVLGALGGLTTFGGKHPGLVLATVFAAFAIFIAIVMMRIGVLDFSWLGLGAI